MIKKLLISFIAIIFFGTLNAQTVLLEEDIKSDTLEIEFGQNLKKFSHLYFELGINSFLQDAGAEINPAKSNIYKIAYRHKRKICNFYAIGFDFNFTNSSFSIKQTLSKQIPYSTNHDKESIATNSLGAEFYNRFNFGRRGNMIGKYLDIGVFGNFIFNKKHKTINKTDTPNFLMGKNLKVINSGLIYVQNYTYGINVRLGINRFALSASYRLSDIFKTEAENITFNYPELPRLSIGMQIGLF